MFEVRFDFHMTSVQCSSVEIHRKFKLLGNTNFLQDSGESLAVLDFSNGDKTRVTFKGGLGRTAHFF